jgi:isocitrate dehydrogenase
VAQQVHHRAVIAGIEVEVDLRDETPEVVKFAETLERVCIETVESGKMTKDLAILSGPNQPWMTTEKFFEAIVENLETAMAAG